jgi:hypothetical protein
VKPGPIRHGLRGLVENPFEMIFPISGEMNEVVWRKIRMQDATDEQESKEGKE